MIFEFSFKVSETRKPGLLLLMTSRAAEGSAPRQGSSLPMQTLGGILGGNYAEAQAPQCLLSVLTLGLEGTQFLRGSLHLARKHVVRAD